MTEIENDNIIKTMKLHIKVAKDDVQKLIDVTTVYAEACTYISEYIFNNGFELGFMNLQEKIYHAVRNKFKLKSQMTISAIKTSAARYKSVKEQLFQKPYKYKDENGEWHYITKTLDWLYRPIAFRRPQADLVFNRDYSVVNNSVTGESKLSLNTLKKRIYVDYDLPDNFKEYFDGTWKFGTGKIVSLNGEWYFHIPMTKAADKAFNVDNTEHLIGIDRGLRFLVTTYDEEGKTGFVSGSDIMKKRDKFQQGMSAYCYTGSYQIPVHTLTDSIVKDIMMIQEIIGTGEIAISDHRSSQPTFEEFARVVADTRLGGVLSGKAGIVNVHLGDSPRCLDLIERVVDETEIPTSQILPTHINRNEMLFGKSIEYALKGGAVDFTGNEDIDYWETICDEVRVCNGIKRMLDAGVNPDRMTISSDGQGSLPMYSSDGEFLGMGVGQSSCLLKEVKECVFKTEIPLEIAISTITSNPADILRLKGKGKVEEGYDADLCILDQELQLVEVIAKGNTVYTK